MKEARGWKLLLLAAAIAAAGLALVRPAVHAGIALRRARAEREAELHPWTGLQTLQADSALLYPLDETGSAPWDARILTGGWLQQLRELLERNAGAQYDWSFGGAQKWPHSGFCAEFFYDGDSVASVYLSDSALQLYRWKSGTGNGNEQRVFSAEGVQELAALHAAAPQLADRIADAPEDAQAIYADYSGEAQLPSPAAQTAAEAARAALAAARPYEEGRGAFLAPRTVLTLRYPDYTVRLIEYARVPMHLLRVEVSLFGGADGWPSDRWLQLRPEDGIVRRLGLQTDELD